VALLALISVLMCFYFPNPISRANSMSIAMWS
jgi:hypothetical protein